jgi:hypothetical protein
LVPQTGLPTIVEVLVSAEASRRAEERSEGRLTALKPLTYWIELATDENTLLALEPISRMVPTTITKMTASITAYSAMSWPCSSLNKLRIVDFIC